MKLVLNLEDVKEARRRGTASEVAILLAVSESYVRHQSLDPDALGVLRLGRMVRFDFPQFETWLATRSEEKGTSSQESSIFGGDIVVDEPRRP